MKKTIYLLILCAALAACDKPAQDKCWECSTILPANEGFKKVETTRCGETAAGIRLYETESSRVITQADGIKFNSVTSCREK
jgi:hypothetical protein